MPETLLLRAQLDINKPTLPVGGETETRSLSPLQLRTRNTESRSQLRVLNVLHVQSLNCIGRARLVHVVCVLHIHFAQDSMHVRCRPRACRTW